jgi:ABC-type uncharacterized transport system permease subunit
MITCSTYITNDKKSVRVKFLVIALICSNFSSFPGVLTETNKALKYLEVQKSIAQLDMIDILVRISRQSINEPIPFPTSALNLLVYFMLPI